jgi:triosephosphate isomerase
MRTPLIAGNWKMYKLVPDAVELVEALLAGVERGYADDRAVLICPPFTALYPLAPLLAESSIALGAQNMYYAEQGAFTGEVSPQMLRDIGCSYVLLGHSERRQVFGEDDVLINKKVQAAFAAGLTPVLCIGETKPQRDAGQAEPVTVGQLRAGLGGLTPEQVAGTVIAYEPVWAIGTGDTATPADAQAMHAAIRAALADSFDQAIADDASLQSDSFLRIIDYR